MSSEEPVAEGEEGGEESEGVGEGATGVEQEVELRACDECE